MLAVLIGEALSVEGRHADLGGSGGVLVGPGLAATHGVAVTGVHVVTTANL